MEISPVLSAHQKHTSPFPHYRLTVCVCVLLVKTLIPRCVVLVYQDSSFHNRQKCKTFSAHLSFEHSVLTWVSQDLIFSVTSRSPDDVFRAEVDSAFDLGRCGRGCHGGRVGSTGGSATWLGRHDQPSTLQMSAQWLGKDSVASGLTCSDTKYELRSVQVVFTETILISN